MRFVELRIGRMIEVDDPMAKETGHDDIDGGEAIPFDQAGSRVDNPHPTM